MSSRATADVLVAGAGPAGAWAACCLARGGARVRVFDPSHPREKPCGGGLTGRTLRLIQGAVPRARLGGVLISTGVFDAARTMPVRIALDAPGHARTLLVTDRRTFDAALLDAACNAGAEHHLERITDVTVERGRRRVTTAAGSYDGGWIIGADGVNSLVRRRLKAAFRRDQLSIASGVFAHGRSDSAIVVRFVSSPAGYIWSFPRASHLAAGICSRADETRAAPLRDIFDAWLSSSGLAAGARLERYAWPIPSLNARDLANEFPAGPGFLLAGDAAGLVDPITREGIYFAVLSGQLGAEAILRGSDVAAAYVRALQADVFPELARAASLERGFFHGPFTRLLVDALRQSAPVRATMVDIVSGEQPYRTLKTRLLRTFEWRLAWQLARLKP